MFFVELFCEIIPNAEVSQLDFHGSCLPAFSLCFCVKICTFILSFNRLSCTISGNFESTFEKPLRCAKCFKVAGEGEKKKRKEKKTKNTRWLCERNASACFVVGVFPSCTKYYVFLCIFYHHYDGKILSKDLVL